MSEWGEKPRAPRYFTLSSPLFVSAFSVKKASAEERVLSIKGLNIVGTNTLKLLLIIIKM